MRKAKKHELVRADSGQVSAFVPAVKVKPQGVWGWISSLRERFIPRVEHKESSEQGAAATPSPSTYYQTLWQQRYERQTLIQDCMSLMYEDQRLRRMVLKAVNEACRGGFQFKISNESKRLAKKAEQVGKKVAKLFPTPELEGFARTCVVSGDAFTQFVVSGEGDLVKAICMPSISMERLSDDTDTIINPLRAYAQIDITTQQEIATWPMALMHHARWQHIPGSRYGEPEAVAARRLWRILKLMEESNAVSRMTRASIARLWNIGTPENPGTVDQVKDFKALNGYKEGEREIFDPTEGARDFFANGPVSCDTLQANETQEDIADILHVQDALLNSGMTPSAIIGINLKDINRDVLEDIRSEWLKDTRRINDILDQIIGAAFELALMLEGIDPDLVVYKIVWTTSSIERPAEHIKSICEQYLSGLKSLKAAVTELLQYSQVEDIEEEIKMIKEEADTRQTPWKSGTPQKSSDPGGDPTVHRNGKAKASGSRADSRSLQNLISALQEANHGT